MKKDNDLFMPVFTLIILGMFAFFLFSDFEKPALEISQRERLLTERVTETAEQIKYIYEPRAGLCFAILSQDQGIVVSEVPYEKVKDHLINPPENPFEANPFDSPEETTIQTR
jgi:hypothetical protein